MELPFADATFDFATAFMSLMDSGNKPRARPSLSRPEARRLPAVLNSITHPCFDTPHRRILRDENRLTYAIEVGGYFRNLDVEISEWLFGATPPEVKQGWPKFKTPRFTQTVSQWLNLLIEIGFLIERIEEPRPSDETVRACPDMQDAQVVAYFLHIRGRKPEQITGLFNKPETACEK